MNGWTGNLLRVNLTTGQSSVESSEKYFDYIGGKGMANRIIYEEVPTGVMPTDPESKFVLAVGPNTATSPPVPGAPPLLSSPPSPSTTPSWMPTWAAMSPA